MKQRIGRCAGHSGLPGYAVPGRSGDYVALFVPEFAQIWTNPKYSKAESEAALIEEFTHAVQTSFRPSVLLPLRNFLTGTAQHPSHGEFRDIVEAVYCATYPLRFDQSIDPASPLPVCSPYRKLGEQILRLGCSLALSQPPALKEQVVRRDALWAVVLTLLNVVPLQPHQGPRVLRLLERFVPNQPWTNAPHLLGMLLQYLAGQLRTLPGRDRTFTLVPPNDSHQLIFRAVDLFHDYLLAPVERMTPTTPVLLSILSLDIFRQTHLLWWQRNGSKLTPSFEIWPFTRQNIRSLTTAFRTPGIDTGARSPCLARLFHLNTLAFIRELVHRKTIWSYAFLTHELLELFSFLVSSILIPSQKRRFDCVHCQSTFQDARLLQKLAMVAEVPPRRKIDLIQGAAQYDQWLATDCVRRALTAFEVPLEMTRQEPTIYIRARQVRRHDFHSYLYPSAEGKKLGLFLPALGQIWILPACPERMRIQIQSHEQHHFNFCGLQPARLLHLRHVLLGRAMPEPFRFNDIVEASYVLGLTLDAGLPPHGNFFPPAPSATEQLAIKVASEAQRLATCCGRHIEKEGARREAGYALLLLLQHVIPSAAEQGGCILEFIHQLVLPKGWRDRWDLWRQLHGACQHQLAEQHNPPFQLAWPVDPHRSVAEMLTFLAHSLMPILERSDAVLITLPSLINVLSLGSLIYLPLVHFRERTGLCETEVTIIPTSIDLEHAIKKAIHTQSRVLSKQKGRCICTSFLIRLLRETVRLQVVPSSNQAARFLQSFFEHLELDRFYPERFSCPACKAHLTAATIRNSLEQIRLLLPHGRRNLLDAADRYERWLMSENLELAKKVCGIEKALRIVKKPSRLST